MTRDSPDDDGAGAGSGDRPTVEDLPEFDPATWPDGATVDPDDLPPIDPRRQAVRIGDWESGPDGTPEPVFYTLPREQWAREAAYHDAAGTVLERLDDRFEGGYKVWIVPPDEDGPADAGEVVVGYLVEADPDYSMADLHDVVPDDVDGTAGAGTPHEFTVEGIPVVLERTKG